jgi:hypothetical protein
MGISSVVCHFLPRLPGVAAAVKVDLSFTGTSEIRMYQRIQWAWFSSFFYAHIGKLQHMEQNLNLEAQAQIVNNLKNGPINLGPDH